MKPIKIDTNDIKGFIENLEEKHSLELFEKSEDKWNGLPITSW